MRYNRILYVVSVLLLTAACSSTSSQTQSDTSAQQLEEEDQSAAEGEGDQTAEQDVEAEADEPADETDEAQEDEAQKSEAASGEDDAVSEAEPRCDPDEKETAEAKRRCRMANEAGENKTIIGSIGANADSKSAFQEGAGSTTMDEAFANAESEETGQIEIGEAEFSGSGELDEKTYRSVLKRRARSALRCYQKALEDSPDARGDVIIALTIDKAGRVTQAKVEDDQVGSDVGACVRQATRRFRFPRPKGGSVEVEQTYRFSP